MKLTIQNPPIKAASLILMAMLLVFALPNQSSFAQTESGEIHQEVDEMPMPSDGIDGWNDYLAKNMKYPKAARKANVEGRVLISFVVQTTGEISNAEIVSGIGGGCDEEVLRLVKESPKWKPGKKDGQVVNTQMMLPVNFRL
ncbi:protein TonB [Algoriphagus sp. 4150]|uniref:energy transducer TonB n=1 Tax=Algoriphagus sp. 4150 TaxID=2817756 RepID=UPI00285C8E67|nr:energy transducer TonB [Algoriphagus sp. 4150]MDR7129660.1 protein TonB [Algoriphagus sp. 4150]